MLVKYHHAVRIIHSNQKIFRFQSDEISKLLCFLKTSKSLDFNKKETFLSVCIYNSTFIRLFLLYFYSFLPATIRNSPRRTRSFQRMFKIIVDFPSLTRSKIRLFYVYLNFSPSLVISFCPHGSTMSLNYFTRRNQYAFTELNIERVPPFCSIISNDLGR